MKDCLFCKIIAKQVPSEKVYEDEAIYAFRDIYPKAPVHVLIVPKIHIDSLQQVNQTHDQLLVQMSLALPKIATLLGLEGFRTIINTGEAGGQEIFHLHYHLLGDAQGKRLPVF